MADKKFQMKQKTGANTYDNLYPVPATHGSTHSSNGSDPLPSGAVGTNQLASGVVTKEKIANGAVTNEKTDFSAGFSPAGRIILTSGVHYFSNISSLPSDAVTGQIALVKV